MGYIQNFSDGRKAPCGGRLNRSTNSASAKNRLGIFSDGRQVPCGGHCNRSTNSAKAKDRFGVFSDGREAPPGGRCNRSAKRRRGCSIQNFLGCRASEPSGSRPTARQNSATAESHSALLGCPTGTARSPTQLRDRDAPAVIFRISRMADRHRAEVIVTAAQILPRRNLRRLPRRSRMAKERLEVIVPISA